MGRAAREKRGVGMEIKDMSRESAVENKNRYEYGYDRNAVRKPVYVPETLPGKQPGRIPARRPAPRHAKKPRWRIHPMFVAALLICTVVFIAMISMWAELAALSGESYRLAKSIESMEKEQSYLKYELNNQMTPKQIEEYAVDELGMVKLDPSRIVYLGGTDGDSFEIGAFSGGSKSVFDLAAARLSGYAEAIWSFIN